MIIGIIFSVISLIADYNYQQYLQGQFDEKSDYGGEYLQVATKTNQWEDTYWNHLGQTYALAGENSQSSEFYRKMVRFSVYSFGRAIKLNKYDDNHYFYAANTYLRAGRNLKSVQYLKQSVVLFQKGLNINPRSGDAYLNLGSAFAQLGDLKKAKKAWRKALKYMPENSDVYYNLGWLYEQQDEPLRALKYYRQAFERDESNIDAKEGILRLEEAIKTR